VVSTAAGLVILESTSDISRSFGPGVGTRAVVDSRRGGVEPL
jgi:hypothetical protein